MSDQEPIKQDENIEAEQATEATEQVDATEQAEATNEVSAKERIAQLEAELAAAQAKVQEQQDSVVRAAAEVDNIRRRAAVDVEKAHKFALEKFANELLPVIDNLERAIQFSDKENEDSLNF